MRIWVFRISNRDGGDPDTTCPTKLNNDALYTGQTGEKCHLTYGDGALDFVLKDLADNQRLRQGWGIPTLDLRLPEDVWIENYIIASERYWGLTNSCEHACGRRRILKGMLEMNPGDVIYIPNVNKSVCDEGFFSVCRVKGKYFFEDRSYLKNNWEKDFGHVIPIKNLLSYKYSDTTLPRSIFGAPYRHAIDESKAHYQSYGALSDFAAALP